MPDPTTHYSWAQPDVGGDTGAWGGILNTLHDAVDSDLRAHAGKLSEQLLYPAAAGLGAAWEPDDSALGGAHLTSIASGDELIIPLPNLRVGQRITAFRSFGEATGTWTGTVKLYRLNNDGTSTELSAGHSLPASAASTTTSGLTIDVAAAKAYVIVVVVAGSGSGTVKIHHVELTVSKTP